LFDTSSNTARYVACSRIAAVFFPSVDVCVFFDPSLFLSLSRAQAIFCRTWAFLLSLATMHFFLSLLLMMIPFTCLPTNQPHHTTPYNIPHVRQRLTMWSRCEAAEIDARGAGSSTRRDRPRSCWVYVHAYSAVAWRRLFIHGLTAGRCRVTYYLLQNLSSYAGSGGLALGVLEAGRGICLLTFHTIHLPSFLLATIVYVPPCARSLL